MVTGGGLNRQFEASKHPIRKGFFFWCRGASPPFIFRFCDWALDNLSNDPKTPGYLADIQETFITIVYKDSCEATGTSIQKSMGKNWTPIPILLPYHFHKNPLKSLNGMGSLWQNLCWLAGLTSSRCFCGSWIFSGSAGGSWQKLFGCAKASSSSSSSSFLSNTSPYHQLSIILRHRRVPMRPLLAWPLWLLKVESCRPVTFSKNNFKTPPRPNDWQFVLLFHGFFEGSFSGGTCWFLGVVGNFSQMKWQFRKICQTNSLENTLPKN